MIIPIVQFGFAVSILAFFMVLLLVIANWETDEEKSLLDQYVVNVWEFCLIVVGVLVGTVKAPEISLLIGVNAVLFFSGFITLDKQGETPLGSFPLFTITFVWELLLFFGGVGLGLFL